MTSVASPRNDSEDRLGMAAVERLRQLAEALPPGGAVTVPRDFIVELAREIASAGERDLTVREVAAQFGRSPSTVRAWLERGALRGYHFRGREWRVTRVALAEFRGREQHAEVPVRQPRKAADLAAWRAA